MAPLLEKPTTSNATMKTKICWLILNMFIVTVSALAQPQIKLQRTIGGNADDFLYSFVLTADGGSIAGGTSYSGIAGDKTQNTRGGADYWIVKMDSNGHIEWDKSFGGSDYDNLKVIEPTTDGGYILGGFSQSNISGEKTENSRGFYDYWIIKLDNNGNIQWNKTLGGFGQDFLSALKQTADGGYIAGGYSFSNISGEKSERSRGNFDYWIVKLNSSGALEWDKTIGGAGEDDLRDIALTKDGGYIVSGSSQSGISGEKTQASRGSSDYWVVKLDNAGHIQWDKTYGGQSVDELSTVMQTSDGGYLLGGYSMSDISGEKKQNSKGQSDYWLIKTDSLGKMLWSQTYGGNSYDNFSSMQSTSDGGYILAGTSQSNISGDKTENARGAGYEDYWVIKLNSRGKIEWDKTIGGDLGDIATMVKETAKNNYVIGGYSNSGVGYDKTTDTKGGYDFWLVKLKYIKPDSAITVLPNTMQAASANINNGFSVYPNPAKDVLHINTNDKASFGLSDQNGKLILTKTITNSGDIDVSKLPAGVYFLVNKSSGVSQKVVIRK